MTHPHTELTTATQQPEWTRPETIIRYWNDPAFAAQLDTERDAVLAAYWGPIDARRRAEQAAIWGDDLPEGLEA